jgi:CO dehydrogenase maturation factor
MLSQIIEKSDQVTIVDMEASVEHMSRGTVRHADVMLVVTEPYYRSLETVARTVPLAHDLGIKQVYVVANKVREDRDEEVIRAYCAERGFELITVFPFDPSVTEADLSGKPILDRQPDSTYVQIASKLVDKLLIPEPAVAVSSPS